MVEQRSEEPRVASSILALGTKRIPLRGSFFVAIFWGGEYTYAVHKSGCSSDGRARGLGPRGRRFETCRPDQRILQLFWGIFCYTRFMSLKNVADLMGWYGMLAILGAYFLSSFKILSNAEVTYQILNITGAFGVMWSSWVHKSWPATVLNSLWMVIGLGALTGMLLGIL